MLQDDTHLNESDMKLRHNECRQYIFASNIRQILFVCSSVRMSTGWQRGVGFSYRVLLGLAYNIIRNKTKNK